MSTTRNIPEGASVATYNDELFHVFEPCACGFHCHAVMVQSVANPHGLKPWPIIVEVLENPTPVAKELIAMVRR